MPKAKTRVIVETIGTLEEANLVLKEIGLLVRQLEALDAETHKCINKIKEDALKAGAPARERLARAEQLISDYAKSNKKSLFKDARSVKLAFGSFGFRKSTSISIKDTTLALLKKWKMPSLITVKETPNKEALALQDDKFLAKVDAVRKEKENFFCEPDMEEVNKLLKKLEKSK
jgi:phage host-nuclease inhibitor protein Gam